MMKIDHSDLFAILFIVFAAGLVVGCLYARFERSYLRRSAETMTKEAAKWKRKSKQLMHAIEFGETWKYQQ
jgi:hypothetical protein